EVGDVRVHALGRRIDVDAEGRPFDDLHLFLPNVSGRVVRIIDARASAGSTGRAVIGGQHGADSGLRQDTDPHAAVRAHAAHLARRVSLWRGVADAGRSRARGDRPLVRTLADRALANASSSQPHASSVPPSWPPASRPSPFAWARRASDAPYLSAAASRRSGARARPSVRGRPGGARMRA